MPENEFRIITPIPEDNTSEAIVYGSAYRFAKSSKFFWDQLEDMILQEIEDLKGQLIDREFCSHVLNSPGMRSMIYRKSPPVSDPDQIKDLWTLRRISNLGSGLHHLDALRSQNLMWATMTGVREYTSKMMELGISDRQWKVASDGIDMPIEYATVRGILERDEQQSLKDVEEMEEDIESRRKECERFQRDLENYRRLNRESVQDDGPEDIPDIPIYMEMEEDVPESLKREVVIPPEEGPMCRMLDDVLTTWTVDVIDVMCDTCRDILEDRQRLQMKASDNGQSGGF